MVRPLTTRPDSEPRVTWRDGVETRLHARGAAALCVIEQWCDRGTGAPTHTHDVEEVITVIAGTADFWVDGVGECVEAGGSIVLPAGSRHGFRNTNSVQLHTLAVFASASPHVEYEHEPGTVLEIGGGGRPYDAHRSHHRDEGER
jgi:mannose-6-phosphate isomerase-like protein (cupin superfamily)